MKSAETASQGLSRFQFAFITYNTLQPWMFALTGMLHTFIQVTVKYTQYSEYVMSSIGVLLF